MGRKSSSRILRAWMNGELVGVWEFHRGENLFAYDSRWLISKRRRPISLSLPLRAEVYRGLTVYNFFDNLLPDNAEIRRRIQTRYQTDTTDPFELLAEIGRDCVGALQLLPPDEEPTDVQTIRGAPLTEQEIEEVLRNLGAPQFGHDTAMPFRISLAGAQEKTAFLRHNGDWMEPLGATPTTHIFKLPMGKTRRGLDLTTSIENEWLCHRILQEIGIPVAACEIAQFGELKVLVVERFDRQMSKDGGWLARIPQEDMCQATGVPPSRKYEQDGGPGIRKILDLLSGAHEPDADRRDFFKTLVVDWLLCAIDGHAKNFSLFLETAGRYRLTPRYDVLSAFPMLGHGAEKISEHEAEMAMAVWGENRHYKWLKIQPRHWLHTAKDCGLDEPEALLHELHQQVPGAVERAHKSLPEGFPAPVAEPILAGLERCAKRLSG